MWCFHTKERSLFYICCGRRSNQAGRFQYEDQGHRDPEKETRSQGRDLKYPYSLPYIFYKTDTDH